MQVNKQNIQRPSLIESFFNKELTPSNEFVTYINCTNNSSNVVHRKNVTSKAHNIKKSLKTKKFIVSSTIKKGFDEIKQANKFRDTYLKTFLGLNTLQALIQITKFHTPLSHNNILSLM